jgi:hypothetical protein
VTGPFLISLGGFFAASAAGTLNAPTKVATDSTATNSTAIVFSIILATCAHYSYIWVGEQYARFGAANFKGVFNYRISLALKDG